MTANRRQPSPIGLGPQQEKPGTLAKSTGTLENEIHYHKFSFQV